MASRSVLIKTAFNGFALVFLGVQISQRGPAFIDLILISGTDVEGGSAYVTGGNLCYMVGSFISGYLFSRVKMTSVTIALAVIFAGVLIGITPWCTSFISMLFIFSTTTIFTGFFETTINTDQMKICHGKSDWAMQFLSFCYSVGGIIGPLITEPFLAPKDTANVTEHDGSFNYTHIPSNVNGFPNISNVMSSENHMLTSNQRPSSGNDVFNRSDQDRTEYPIRYAFLITTGLGFITSIPFFVQCVRSCSKEDKKEEHCESMSFSRKLPRKVYVGIVAIASLYYFLFTAVDDAFVQYLSYFVVNHLDWHKQDGALVTAVYWIFSTCVKLALIFLASHINTGTILLVSNIGMVTSYLGFTIVSQLHVHSMVWVFTALIALSVSAVFGGGMAWVDRNLLQMDGKATASVVISAAFGATVMPIPIGVLMKNWTTMAFAYLLFGLSCLDVLVIIVLLFITKPFIHQKYGPPRPDIECEVSAKEDHNIDNANGDLLPSVESDVNKPLKEGDTDEAAMCV